MVRESRKSLHEFSVNGSTFRVPVKYALKKSIGQGAYGVVCSARNTDREEGEPEFVAIKKTFAFDDEDDAKRILREIKLLHHFQHENVINLIDIVKPPSEDFNELYIVTELMDTDLSKVIKSSQQLENDHYQYFIYQLLRGLKYIHSANVLHRDLKPGNILVNINCDLKICDFGLARMSSEDSEGMTEYVVTRWYRAPENLLSAKHYTGATDVWSVGCILGELITRRPIFPGRDHFHQIDLILSVIGSPTDKDVISRIENPRARAYIQSLPQRDRRDLRDVIPNADPNAIDLLERIFVFDPSKRITVDEALAHPYLAALHDSTDEPVHNEPFSFDFEKEKRPISEWKKLIYDQIRQYHPENFDEVEDMDAEESPNNEADDHHGSGSMDSPPPFLRQKSRSMSDTFASRSDSFAQPRQLHGAANPPKV